MQLRYNYRLYPTAGQRIALTRAFGCARVVFNDGLAARQAAHQAGLPYPSDRELSARLTSAMATVEEGLQAQIRNIEATYGKPMREWLAIVASSGLTKHTDVVRMLKTDYGLAHGAAHRVSLVARDTAAVQGGPDQAADPVSALYTGKKASLRPLHDALMNAILAFGDDIELAPKKGYLSLRRRKQFAMIQPSATGRIDLGLILGDVPPETRLESAAGFNALFTHRVRLSGPADIDEQLIAWLRQAYDRAS